MRIATVVLALLPLSAAAQTFNDIRVYATGGTSSSGEHGQADYHALHLELGHALSPRTTAALVVSPTNVWQPRSWFGDQYGDGNESVQALAASVLIRRTFRIESPVQWYLDASTGPMFSEKRVPASTSRFNFVTQGGAGVVFNASGRVPILAGYRFSHVSNGGYSPRNPGLNVSSIVVGVRLR